jgi:hypothetical protein
MRFGPISGGISSGILKEYFRPQILEIFTLSFLCQLAPLFKLWPKCQLNCRAGRIRPWSIL